MPFFDHGRRNFDLRAQDGSSMHDILDWCQNNIKKHENSIQLIFLPPEALLRGGQPHFHLLCFPFFFFVHGVWTLGFMKNMSIVVEIFMGGGSPSTSFCCCYLIAYAHSAWPGFNYCWFVGLFWGGATK